MSAPRVRRGAARLVAALLLAAPAAAFAGAPSVDCREPYVFGDGAVNLVVLPYRYYSDDASRHGSQAASQIPLLLQSNGLLQMLRYGSVGSINLVNAAPGADCTPDAVLGALTSPLDAPGHLRRGRGLILVWGALYEEQGQLQVQTFMRVLRGGTDESFEADIGGGRRMAVRPSSTTLAFAPQDLDDAQLAAIGRAFWRAAEVRTAPSDTARKAPFTFYDPYTPGTSYQVQREQRGWLFVKDAYGRTGWVRADLGGGSATLADRLPEVEFIGLAAGYLRARVAAGTPGDRAPARTLEWVRGSLARFLARSGPDADEVTAAVGRQLVALTACALADTAAPAGVLADTLAAAAAAGLPNDPEAQRMAGAMTLRADAGRGAAAERGALVERRFARAAVIAGGDSAALGDLRTLYAISAARTGEGPVATRLAPDVAAQRLALLERPAQLAAPAPDSLEGWLARGPMRLAGTTWSEDSPALSVATRAQLDTIARVLRQNPGIRITIAGHTDTRQSGKKSLLLSQRWAALVREYLVTSGVPDSQVTSLGYGKTRPLVLEREAKDRELNRRVEVELVRP